MVTDFKGSAFLPACRTHLLAQITRAVAQDHVPRHLHIAVRADQIRDQFPAWQPFRETRRVRIDGKATTCGLPLSLSSPAGKIEPSVSTKLNKFVPRFTVWPVFLSCNVPGKSMSAFGYAGNGDLVVVQSEVGRGQPGHGPENKNRRCPERRNSAGMLHLFQIVDTSFSMAACCCSMDSTSLNWVRQRSRLWPSRCTLK